MPTSAHEEVSNSPKGFVKIGAFCVGRCGHRPLQPITLRIHKKILPSRRFGTRAYLLRGATQIRRRFKASLLRRKTGCAVPGDFGAERLIRMLGGCPSRCCCKGLSALRPSLWADRKPVLLPRRRKNQGYRIVFLLFIIMRQSRSPRCRPRISISAEARFVAHGTLDESHRRSVRMMR